MNLLKIFSFGKGIPNNPNPPPPPPFREIVDSSEEIGGKSRCNKCGRYWLPSLGMFPSLKYNRFAEKIDYTCPWCGYVWQTETAEQREKALNEQALLQRQI